ncbi:vWA domain-containing protein [Microlunatus capsulatus]|uniref:VWFA domain-containing protein n=1 Tax=Microlunatus capsulatus TaxID=99117 RepID=A0ABS4Z901_9ACTN|nr:vWA domain-containing protein [Microlunatus capsulatus]MBP2417192.1 hypothetical protein [Microlunatus capsulatus]
MVTLLRAGPARAAMAPIVLGVLMATSLIPAVAAPVIEAEPDWPGRCPVTVALVVDQSASLEGSFDKVRQASEDMVDALRDRPSQVMIVAFGTEAQVVEPLTDVSDPSGRRRVKRSIDNLDTFSNASGQGGTNWEAGLALAAAAKPQIVVVLTDGLPNAYGNPVQGDEDGGDAALLAAQKVANGLKRAGTRVVPVGIALGPGGTQNLAAISGNRPGEDYFATDLDRLRRELYGVAARSCGVPISALPTPEPTAFPLAKTLIGAAVGLVALLIAGMVLNRRRNGPPTVAPLTPAASKEPRKRSVGRAAPLKLADVAPPVPTRTKPEPPEAADSSPPASPPSRARSMSLDFLRDESGPAGHQRPPDE